MGFFDRLLGRPGAQADKRVGWFAKAQDDLDRYGDEYADLPDEELAETAAKLFTLEDRRESLTRYAALVREAADRALGERPYFTQLKGLIGLLDGMVVQMLTGEGKTLVGAMAAGGYALQGRTVHVVSVNDYLAARDVEWMRPLFDMLGVTAASVGESDSEESRRKSYTQEVVYASVQEVGFDTLRDRFLTQGQKPRIAQRDVVIVDEADSVLIDEARVPLVLAGTASVEQVDAEITRLVAGLEAGKHYELSHDRTAVSLTEAGIDAVEEALGVDLYGDDAETLAAVNLALYALAVVHRDVDYLVVDGSIKLISDSRGRVADLQRWPDGLQAAVEAKEGLTTSSSGEILDQMTVEELIQTYSTVCGMTGTALAVGDDLKEFYDLEISAVEPNEEVIRIDEPDRLYTYQESKERAIVDQVLEEHREGRPILIGTRSVAESESLAHRLKQRGVEVRVLNAKDDSREADIIARAGESGAVTVSTQMAGRGTDIRLADDEARDAGGLLVIGAGRYDSSRLDDQLRGRSGRQGDPGTSVFFTSLEDELLTRVPEIQRFVEDGDETGFIQSRKAAQLVEHAQRMAEGENTGVHRDTRRFNDLMSKQRKQVLSRREAVLTEDYGIDELLEKVSDRDDVKAAGDDAVRDALRDILLFQIDDRWVAHLAFLNDLREGIHLRTLAKERPHEAFNKESMAQFSQFWSDVMAGTEDVLEEVEFTSDGVDLPAIGMKRPSSTWTYVAAESTFGSDIEAVVKRIRR